jgi:hypothetical protein
VVSNILAKHPDLKLEAIDTTAMPFARPGITGFE